MELQIGSEFGGYRIEALLGRGGSGTVYAAEHMVLGRKAALKTLRGEVVDDPNSRARFIRESRMAAAIEHPNIIPVYDAGEVDGVSYIAMRLVAGCDLAELLESKGRLAVSETLDILAQAGAALDAAHTRGLVHRDVKPANILLEESSKRIYLTDFGIAKEAHGSERLTQEGFFLGTVDYAAPEQIEGKDLGTATDRYAFGCVLFECLSGRRPFVAETQIAVLKAHVLDPPPLLSELSPDLPAAIDATIERALAKDASERFGSCRELLEAARMALGGTTAMTPSWSPTADDLAGAIATRATRPRVTVAPLPRAATALIGRERELAEVGDLLREGGVRLLTLTGLGGTGKTRLALAAAEGLTAAFDLIAFVDLAPAREPAYVPSAVCEALGVHQRSEHELFDVLRERIAGRSALLVLDNFERVLAAAPFVSDLLTRLPEVTALVTSQAPLRIRGERQYAVMPLPLPAPDQIVDLTTAGSSPAVRLFVERARESRADFVLTSKNASDVVEICRQLDGIPLALELAAARVKLLPLHTLRERLGRRLELLTRGSTDMPERQRTLRSAIDWSYELLDPSEQATMAHLGVFVGGCTLELAEAICGEPFALDIGEIVDTVASLVDKSLVWQREGADGEPRFGMLETIREYALERLESRGEGRQLRALHARRFLDLVEGAEAELTSANQAFWLQRLDAENANIRAALAASLETGEVDLALRYAGALGRYWSIRGHMAESRGWLADVLDRGREADPALLGKATFAAGYADLGVGEFGQAERWFERSLELGRAAGDRAAQAAALAQLAWLALTRAPSNPDRASSLAEEAVALGRELDDKRTTSGALNTLGELALENADSAAALALFEESLSLRRGLGDKRLVANSLVKLGRAHLVVRQKAAATGLLGEALAVARDLRDGWSESEALSSLGKLRMLEGAPAAADDLFRASLRIALARRDRRVAADALLGIAAASAQDDPLSAARLYGATQTLLEEIGALLSPAERIIEEPLAGTIALLLSADELELSLAEGRALDLDQAAALALPGEDRDAAVART